MFKEFVWVFGFGYGFDFFKGEKFVFGLFVGDVFYLGFGIGFEEFFFVCFGEGFFKDIKVVGGGVLF